MTRRFSKVTLSAAALSLALTGGTTTAHASDLLKGVIIGGGAAIIGGCVTGAINCKGKNKSQSRSGSSQSYQQPQTYNPQRQQNVEVQRALNGFNFPAGTPDGILGSRSRGAIADYQRYMNYPPTGQLTDFERRALVDSWNQYQAGAGGRYPNMMSAVGPRGLLRTAQDPNYPSQFGDNAGNGYGGQYGQNGYNGQNGYDNQYGGQNGYNNQYGGQNDYYESDNDYGEYPEAELQPQGQIQPLKPLKPLGQASVTPASHCELVELTSRTQGYITAASLTDPNRADRALSEKFCEARSFSISQSQFRASEFAISDNELNNVCSQVASAHRSTVTSLSSASAGQIVTQARATTNQLGLDQNSAVIYGQICLGIGYRQDDPAMALAGALTLVAAGELPYGEVVAHHLRKGFGTGASAQAAVGWYDDAISALENGAAPAFEPSTTKDRISIIRAAIAQGGLQAERVELPRVVPVGNTVFQ